MTGPAERIYVEVAMGKIDKGQVQVLPFAEMSQVNPKAAGLDIGAQEIVVCVGGGAKEQLVRSFGTYTIDLRTIANWLKENDIESLAMESTGVYWISLFEELERQGILTQWKVFF